MSPVSKAPYDEIALIDELADELGVTNRPNVRRVEWEGDGRVLSGLRWGTGDPSMVLLHGGSLTCHSWDAMLLLLGVPALALDLPGHGCSSWFDEPLYLPRAVAAAMAPAIAALAPDCPVLVGHSLGALSGLALAASVPAQVSRLVVVDATPGSTPERSQDILDFVADADFESIDAVVEHALSRRPTRSPRALRRSLLHNTYERDDGRWTWRHDARSHPTRDRWDIMFEELPKGWEDAAAVRCPMLLIRGARSKIVHEADVDRYRELVPDLRVERIEGAGHNVHSDDPGALGAAILRFVEATGGCLPGQ